MKLGCFRNVTTSCFFFLFMMKSNAIQHSTVVGFGVRKLTELIPSSMSCDTLHDSIFYCA